jgi:hypothetical protein
VYKLGFYFMVGGGHLELGLLLPAQSVVPLSLLMYLKRAYHNSAPSRHSVLKVFFQVNPRLYVLDGCKSDKTLNVMFGIVQGNVESSPHKNSRR